MLLQWVENKVCRGFRHAVSYSQLACTGRAEGVAKRESDFCFDEYAQCKFMVVLVVRNDFGKYVICAFRLNIFKNMGYRIEPLADEFSAFYCIGF